MHPHLIQELHQEAKIKAVNFKKAESELIDVLIRLDEHQIFIPLGYGSLFDYCLRELGLSEANTCNFISVARKARQVPELGREIASGHLSISKARKIVPVLTRENAGIWLEKAQVLTHKALEHEVAKERPQADQPVRSRYIDQNRLRLELSVSEDLLNQLAQVQNLLSQRRKKTVSLEEALAELTGEYLERRDPVKKAERALARKELRQFNLENCNEIDLETPSDATLHVARQAQNWQEKHELRQVLKRSLKHQVTLRDGWRCTFIYPNGERCKSQRHLEMHHLLPVSLGGKNDLNNLKILCSAHHKHMHCRPVSNESLEVALFKN